MQDFRFAKQQFVKMHGTGNSFIIVRDHHQTDENFQKIAQKICDYNFGIGADGLLVIAEATPRQIQNQNVRHAKYHMKVFNKDGSMANMCGNGLRCFAACLKEFDFQSQKQFLVKTGNGLKKINLNKQSQNVYRVGVQMGKYQTAQTIQDISQRIENLLPEFKPIKSYLINFNIPHTVIIVSEMPSKQKLIQYGKVIQKEIDSNINFVKIQNVLQNQTELYIRTYERGAGLTLACGTGACASVVVGLKNKIMFGKVKARTQGGVILIQVVDQKVFKDGPAEFICYGTHAQL